MLTPIDQPLDKLQDLDASEMLVNTIPLYYRNLTRHFKAKT